MKEETTENGTQKGEGTLKKFFSRQENVVAIVLVLLCIMMSIVRTETFLTTANVFNVLRQSSLYIILAMGMALIIITGGIDLSIGSIIAVSACLGAYLAQRINNVPVIIVLCVVLLTGCLCGLINGGLVALAGIPPFIVTLGMLSVGKGVALLVSNGAPIRYEKTWLSVFGGNYIGPVPISVLVMAVISVIMIVFANCTITGRNIYAIGNSERAAKLSGIAVERTVILVYVLMGLLASICGILLMGQMNSADPTFGSGYEMDTIAAAVIGGVSMSGGEGRLSGTIVGALLMSLLRNMFVLLAISGYWQTIILGCVIVLSVAIDCIGKKRKSR
ncbi:ABC transporter permease [Muricomes intestini]|jgi:ribose transport system permease protein|uniref:Ribose transport system permease protein n=2 Tax=Muricomes intestini TaxID=1796634 RepID=A0A4R3K376_9FIRM|nr:ABC transporter permease [Muricomes intestini]TCS77129.1 ribose transport system permease protein [Muricomes intestini]HCR82154.1 ribose ABC transporter permease [Lachnospiraceae bacterium]